MNTHFAAATGRFGDSPPEEGDFLEPADIADAIVTALRQPRRLRTALWSTVEPGRTPLIRSPSLLTESDFRCDR